MFLRSLVDEGMLQFEIKDWTWNNVEVNAKVVSENVAAILINTLNRLGESKKSILKIAGCLGGRFAKSTVRSVVTSLSEKDPELDWHETLSSLDQIVHEFEKEGLWEKDQVKDVWRFSHDKIQLVAFELIPPDERDSFRGEIGNILLKKLDSEALEANLFEVVSLCNFSMAIISDDDERKELAKMNLQAGMKVRVLSRCYGVVYLVHLLMYTLPFLYIPQASANAAFDSAAIYFKAGRKVLGSHGWSIAQQTMLKLSSEGANACFISGDLDTMHELINEVMSQDISMVDKFNVTE